MLKDELEAIIASDSIWAGRSTLVLAFGILGEYVILPFLEEKKGHWKRAAKAFCAILVLAGIVGEYGFSKRIARLASELQTISDSELADATDRASRAEERASANDKEAKRLGKLAADEALARVRIEENITWRRLTRAQQSTIGAHLRRFAGQPANMWYSNGDKETETFALEIAAALYQAQWMLFAPASLETMAGSGIRFLGPVQLPLSKLA